ncbi:hypothetical protein [Carboxylicivirga sp. N1Y90]|uniref:hypothetical protein n=1 Tax=Carboxylicivirga fragile TaxID=3417571 RepID=UPI003D33E757|nr:hypothetical protein [Marinilabiliaceae bacterium N1Y90]
MIIEFLNLQFEVFPFKGDQVNFYLIGISILVIFIYGYLQLKKHYTHLSLLDSFINEFYKDEGLSVLSISKYSFADRIKYGVPVSPFIGFVNTGTSFFMKRNAVNVFRIVELSNSNGKEYICYLEITFLSGDRFSLKEIDMYEF